MQDKYECKLRLHGKEGCDCIRFFDVPPVKGNSYRDDGKMYEIVNVISDGEPSGNVETVVIIHPLWLAKDDCHPGCVICAYKREEATKAEKVEKRFASFLPNAKIMFGDKFLVDTLFAGTPKVGQIIWLGRKQHVITQVEWQNQNPDHSKRIEMLITVATIDRG